MFEFELGPDPEYLAGTPFSKAEGLFPDIESYISQVPRELLAYPSRDTSIGQSDSHVSAICDQSEGSSSSVEPCVLTPEQFQTFSQASPHRRTPDPAWERLKLFGNTTPSSVPSKARAGHTRDTWEDRKPEIAKLYLEDDLKLKQVKDEMDKRGFVAT